MKLDAGVVRPGEATSSQAARGHVEIASVFLNHDVGSHFGCSKKRVFGLVDGKGFGNPMLVIGIGIIPPRREFLERYGIGPVAIDLIGGHVNEWRFGTGAAGGFKEVQRADGIGVEVVEGNSGCTVVRGLRRSVNDHVGAYGGHEVDDALAVANIKFVMLKIGNLFLEAALIPAGIALWTKKCRALVVIDAVDLGTLTCKKE